MERGRVLKGRKDKDKKLELDAAAEEPPAEMLQEGGNMVSMIPAAEQ